MQKMIKRLMNENMELLKEAQEAKDEAKLHTYMQINSQLVAYMKEFFARTGTVIRK